MGGSSLPCRGPEASQHALALDSQLLVRNVKPKLQRMPRERRSRLVYAIAIIVITILGLASRKYQPMLPDFIGRYAGDTLWTAMVLLL